MSLGMGWGLVAMILQCFDTRGERHGGHDYTRVLCRRVFNVCVLFS